MGIKLCLTWKRSRNCTLRKHANSNILKILPAKIETFQIKKFLYFTYFWSNHRGGSNEYPQSIFLSRNKKKNVYPCKPQFYYIKVGFKGVKIIRACFRDDLENNILLVCSKNDFMGKDRYEHARLLLCDSGDCYVHVFVQPYFHGSPKHTWCRCHQAPPCPLYTQPNARRVWARRTDGLKSVLTRAGFEPTISSLKVECANH